MASIGLALAVGSGLFGSDKDPLPMTVLTDAKISVEPVGKPHVASQSELDFALAHSKASVESKERMAAELRGEKSLFDAGKLTGQAKIDFLEHAARDGVAAAAERLGEMLTDGETLYVDLERGAAYLRSAALGGRQGAAHRLGLAYSKGMGVARDYREALAWLIVARTRGDDETARGDDTTLENQLRAFLARSEYSAAVGAGEARARELQVKHTREEILAALPAVAPLVYDAGASATTVDQSGRVTSPGEVEASDGPPEVVVFTITGTRLTWQTLTDLRRDARKGDAGAQDALGRVLLAGKLVPEDPLQATDAFEHSAAQGNLDAAYELSGLYSTGPDVLPDATKAFAYCQQAAQGGVVPAMVNLGVFYTNGRGTARDPVAGLAWLCVAKHFGEQSQQESRLRAFLVRNRPDDVAKAEALAAKLIPEVAARMH